jgi:predicted enzyme related to lactoylglutathione lyase
MELIVNIDVDDVEAGVRFYTEALGLERSRQLAPHVVELRGAGPLIHLLGKAPGTEPFTGAASPRDYRRHWTPVHLDLVVDDLDAYVARAEAAGAHCEQMAEPPFGRIAIMADPFGHGFCLIEFRGRGYDELAAAPPRG